MARKDQAKSHRKKPSGVAEGIIDAALALARTRDWRTVSLSDIADEAGVSLAQVYTVFSSKAAIVGGFMKRIDQHVLDGAAVDSTESARDRLFEVLMRRFDALAPHKDAVAAILAACAPNRRRRSPRPLACCAPWRGCWRPLACPPMAFSAWSASRDWH